MDQEQKRFNGGLLIIFEGIDGAGKTTQIRQAEKILKDDNWLVVNRRNPGGTAIGEELRTSMMRQMPRPAMTDLYISAAIQEALIEEIEIQRQNGAIILLDRSPLSIAAYQIYGSGIDPEKGWYFVNDGMKRMKPNVTFIYECAPKIGLERARAISNQFDYFESKPESYFQKVVEGYKEVASRYNAIVIDAHQPIESIHSLTMQHITPLLPQTPIQSPLPSDQTLEQAPAPNSAPEPPIEPSTQT